MITGPWLVTPCICSKCESGEWGEDEDLHGAGYGLDVEVGARGARYEVAATRLKEPDAANDREAGNKNTTTGMQRYGQ